MNLGVTAAGFQKPGKLKDEGIDLDLQERLHNRRAGIEPLIGHTKKGGQLGKSRMKSDAATLAAGYSAVLGFNLRQLIRHQQGKIKAVVYKEAFFIWIRLGDKTGGNSWEIPRIRSGYGFGAFAPKPS